MTAAAMWSFGRMMFLVLLPCRRLEYTGRVGLCVALQGFVCFWMCVSGHQVWEDRNVM